MIDMICKKRKANEICDHVEPENETYHRKRQHVHSTFSLTNVDVTINVHDNAIPSTISSEDDQVMEDISTTTELSLGSKWVFQDEEWPTDSNCLIDKQLNALVYQPPIDYQATSQRHLLESLLPEIQSALLSSSSLGVLQALLSNMTAYLSHLQTLAFQQLQLRTDVLRRGIQNELSATVVSADDLRALDDRIVRLSALVAVLEVEVQALTMDSCDRNGSVIEDWMVMVGESQGIGIAAL